MALRHWPLVPGPKRARAQKGAGAQKRARAYMSQAQMCSGPNGPGPTNVPSQAHQSIEVREDFVFLNVCFWLKSCRTCLELGYLGVRTHPDKVSGRAVDSWADFGDFEFCVFWDFSLLKT